MATSTGGGLKVAISEEWNQFWDDTKKLSKGNTGGVSLWTYGWCVCNGQNLESGMPINTILGVVRPLLCVAGCGCAGIGDGDSLWLTGPQ